MIKVKGIAYCGLACCVCGQNANCVGCCDDGCIDRDWCKNRKCCIKNRLNGCWECPKFTCEGGMINKTRIRAFAKFIKENGENELIKCLDRNEKAGIIYHYNGELVGDYDKHDTEEDIMKMIEYGK